jgi:enolase
MSKIKSIYAREILDSRGNPTIETTIWTDDKHGAVASIPSGASTGKYEAKEIRDGDPLRFQGLGVRKAVSHVNDIISKYIIGQDPTRQNEIDQILLNLDKTPDKSKLGANAILSVSQAVCELGAATQDMPTFLYLSHKYNIHKPVYQHLPAPIFNLINGGRHGAGNLDFQEFHVIPATRHLFSDSLMMGGTIYHVLKQVLIDKKAISSTGDEGGYAPNLYSNEDAIEIIVEAIERAGYKFNQDVYIGLDVAATSFFQSGKYKISDSKDALLGESMIHFMTELAEKYSLFSIEDPLQEEAWEDWTMITSRLQKNTLVIGDDLIVTHKSLLQKAIDSKAVTAVIIKPNQVGTISEAVSVVKLAKANQINTIFSHRSGDTDEDFMADFAVGLGGDFVKFGAPGRGERVSKYNRLLYIEDYLKSQP